MTDSNYIEPGDAFFVKKHSDAIPPMFKSRLAACADISIYYPIQLKPREVELFSTGLIIIPPAGWHWHVYLRSSIPIKYPGLMLANSVGIIDSDYVGPEDELKLVLINHSVDKGQYIPAGERIAQIRLVPNVRPNSFKEMTYEQIKSRMSRGGIGSTNE